MITAPRCPNCKRECKKYRKTVKKFRIWVCTDCVPNRYQVEGSPHWLLDDGTRPIIEALRWAGRELARQIEFHKFVHESPDNDPRWEWFHVY
jgi:hypothetical protein